MRNNNIPVNTTGTVLVLISTEISKVVGTKLAFRLVLDFDLPPTNCTDNMANL
jgi:hypothetical protein